MGKYNTYSRREPLGPKKNELPPVLRGVGFAMMILIPLISFAAADTLLKYNQQYRWVAIPVDLLAKNKALPKLLWVEGVLTIAIAVALYAVFMMITFLVYRFFGPPQYGPYDVPGVPYRRRK
jgi:hypothetical protein